MANRKSDKSVATKGVSAKAVPAKAAPAIVASTPVRNTAVPPKAAAAAPKAKAPVVVTHAQIAVRAYEIWRSRGGSEHENWSQAERELRGL